MKRGRVVVLVGMLVALLGGHAHALCSTSLVFNGELAQDGPMDWPYLWFFWNAAYSDPELATYRSAPNSWAFWWDGGLYQDLTMDFRPGDRLRVSGYLRTPSWDALREGPSPAP
jgi:hypothetical protein